MQTIEIKPENLIETMTQLKNEFDMLISVSGVDKPEGFEVVYHLYSTKTNNKAVVKARLPKSNTEIDSLCGLYSAANWHEREAYDLLGIRFKDHPDLTRILLPCDWQGYPLRKDYVNNDERLSWNER